MREWWLLSKYFSFDSSIIVFGSFANKMISFFQFRCCLVSFPVKDLERCVKFLLQENKLHWLWKRIHKIQTLGFAGLQE